MDITMFNIMGKPLNDDPFQPQNDPIHKDNPFAPHNGFDSDNHFKPWNDPFGDKNGLTDRERSDYGLPKKKKLVR